MQVPLQGKSHTAHAPAQSTRLKSIIACVRRREGSLQSADFLVGGNVSCRAQLQRRRLARDHAFGGRATRLQRFNLQMTNVLKAGSQA